MNNNMKKTTKVVNRTSSRHLALVIGWISPPRCDVDQSEIAGSRGGGASGLAALTHLAFQHHLPSNAGDLTVHHRTWDPHSKRDRERKIVKKLSTPHSGPGVSVYTLTGQSSTDKQTGSV